MHRRAGKTETLLAMKPMQMIRRAGTYPHVFPRLKQAREVVWKGVNGQGMPYLYHFPPQLMIGPPNQQDMAIQLHHPQGFSRYVLLGTDRNTDAIVGMNSPHIDWDEWSLQNPRARQLAAPILDENDGTEFVIFTPRGKNHAYGLFRTAQSDSRWHVEYLTVDDTRRDGPGESGEPVITHEQIERRRREERDTTPDIDALIDQEYYLSWDSPMPGAYYAKEMRSAEQDGRICELPYDPTRRVHTCWDFGSSVAHDTNSIWFFQMVGRMVHWIDYEQHSNEGVAFFANMLDKKPYVYGSHFAMEKDLDEPDIAEGKARESHFRKLGIEFVPVPKLRLIDGINDVRIALSRSRFDEKRCEEGINGLRSYRREWDDEKKMYLDNPVHDWASHPEAAFRYGAVAILELDDTPWMKEERRPRAAHGAEFNPLSRW